jgi:type II secretory pathway pseudopilin PulG
MSAAMIGRQLKSSTMIETLVALVILMIAFSFGMVIFMKVTTTGSSSKQMRTNNQCKFLVDSLTLADERRDMTVFKDGISYKISFKADAQQPGILIMSVLAEDIKGDQTTHYQQLIQDNEKLQD